MGFDHNLILALNLAGTFAFGLSGGLAAVRARLDFFGVVVLAFVVALAGGTIRDTLIGVPPQTFRDDGYLIAAGSAGVVSFFTWSRLERAERSMTFFDAVGLGVFCVTGATAALDHGLGALQSIMLGTISAVGGGIVRDLLLRQVPTILRRGLYAVPALLGAAVVVVAHQAGSRSEVFPVLGAVLCTVIRLLGVRYDLGLPQAGQRQGPLPGD